MMQAKEHHVLQERESIDALKCAHLVTGQHHDNDNDQSVSIEQFSSSERSQKQDVSVDVPWSPGKLTVERESIEKLKAGHLVTGHLREPGHDSKSSTANLEP